MEIRFKDPSKPYIACSPGELLWILSRNLPVGLSCKNGGDVGEFSVVSVSKEIEQEQSQNNVWGKIRDKIRKRFGTKNWKKIRGTFVLQLF